MKCGSVQCENGLNQECLNHDSDNLLIKAILKIPVQTIVFILKILKSCQFGVREQCSKMIVITDSSSCSTCKLLNRNTVNPKVFK